jgi:hypothetical protein
MMLLAGASRTVVPVSAWPPTALRAAPLPAAAAEAAGAAATAWPAGPDSDFAAPDELALLELAAEHPARNMPPPSRTLPIMRSAMAPCLVRPVRVWRRVKLRVFSMPL